MRYPDIVAELSAGNSVSLKPHGQSMVPIIKSGEKITLSPIEGFTLQKGDVVLAKVNGRYFIHKITALSGDRVQISNNHGHVNGWTSLKQVFGIVTQVGG